MENSDLEKKIAQKLDQLAHRRQAYEEDEQHLQKAIEAIRARMNEETASIQAEVDAVIAPFAAQIAELQEQAVALQARVQLLFDEEIALAAPIQERLADAQAPFQDQVAFAEGQREVDRVVDKQILDDLEEDIREMAEPLGHTVKGSSLMAVWAPGQWNKTMLDGYAAADPRLLACRGEPAVRIQERKR